MTPTLQLINTKGIFIITSMHKSSRLSFAFRDTRSCMAVRAARTVHREEQNQRQAGEDFYFMHKYSILGTLGDRYTLGLPCCTFVRPGSFWHRQSHERLCRPRSRFSYSFDAIRIWGIIELIPLMREDTTDPQILYCKHPDYCCWIFIAASGSGSQTLSTTQCDGCSIFTNAWCVGLTPLC